MLRPRLSMRKLQRAVLPELCYRGPQRQPRSMRSTLQALLQPYR
jgi:hypothetical protein